MGAQAGVFFFDGRPGDAECRALKASLRQAVADEVAGTSGAGIAMACAVGRVWTGEPRAQGPRRSETGLVITFDGRLDNRSDLLLRFHVKDGETSDAALALAMFEHEGVDGLRSLVGDWSLVIWDAPRRMLYLARDYMGVRPLYHYTDAESVRWSTSLAELAARAGRIDSLDEAFVARFMALRFSTDTTPFSGVRAVPTASCLRCSSDRVETRQRFWAVRPTSIRYADKRDYEEHLRMLWKEAVRVRLRTEGPVWAELSGGLDSSSIVCTADALVKNHEVPATVVRPLSHVTLHSPEGDERKFIAEVEAWIGARSAILGVEDHQDVRAPDLEWVTPLAPRGVQLAAAQHVRANGGRVILSGRIGDVVMGCMPDNSVAVFDDLSDGRLLAAFCNMRSWSRASRKPFIEIASKLMVEATQALCGSRTRRTLNDAQRAGCDLLTGRLQGSVDVESLTNDVPAIRLSKRELARLILGYSREARLQVPIDLPGIAYTYPFAHRPLVEFVLAIPGEELSAPGDLRSLMRRAFRGFVPPRILARISKGHYSPAVMRAVRPLATALLPVERLQVVQRDWIDAGRLDAAIRALAAGAGTAGSEIERVLRLEQWLRSRDRRAPAAIPNREEVNADGVLIA